MRRLLAHYWFLLGLLVCIPLGLALGGAAAPERLAQWQAQAGGALSRWLTALVLLLMSATLDTGRITMALKRPRAVLWACLINAAAIPLAAWPLVGLQGLRDFSLGLMVAAAVPCTMAAASVWTRAAGGNDAVSLLTTTATNALGFVVAPFWLSLAAGARLELNPRQMVVPLVISGLAPILVGQALRRSKALARSADRSKALLGIIAQACILVQVFWACLQAGPKLQESGGANEGLAALLVVAASCVGLHVGGLGLGWWGGGLLGLERGDRIAAALAGSQKTLPIGVLICTDPKLLGGAGLPLVVFPMLIYHASQLLIDAVVAGRWRAAGERRPPP